MLVASMIVKSDSAKAEDVALQLSRIPGVTTYGVHKENNIIVVAEAHDEAQLENLSRYVLESFDDVWGVFPVFVASDEAVASEECDVPSR